ncbi:MAG TPA: asparagine synthase-related protein [Candidatus Acidoferrum sp.]|nr:asparagine synthase-related protein [Candidatus Acidoferrum sp.]
MPGLVGLITRMPREWAEPQLLRMLDTLRHEAFYVSGTWVDEANGIYVGWVAREGSFADRMPVKNESGEVTLFFSGEEFPEPGTASVLKARGHVVEPEGPSYLAHRYEDEPDFPRGLNGRFHGLVVDRRRGTATLFNDRYGLQRLYYHEAGDAFYFAAEAKAILKVRRELRSLESCGLGEFIVCGCVLENRTLFSGIHVLPPGSAWLFRGGKLEKKSAYFRPEEWEEEEPLEPETYYASLRDVFVGNLPRYFNGKERLGVSLTGGLDTRIIMAWRKAPPNSLPCYTFGSMYRDNQDVRLARQVAKICGQQHQVITTGKEFLARFAHYAQRSVYLTDACVDLSRSPDLYVNEKVREIAPVRMVGTYGSEMLLHAVMFKAEEPAAGLFQCEVEPQIHAAKKTYEANLQVHPMTFVAFRQSPWHHFGVLGLEQSQVAVRSPFLDNDLVKTLYKAPGSIEINQDARVRLIREGNPDLANLRTDRGTRGVNSIFTRGFHEFFFKAEYAYDYGMPQWIAQVDHMVAPLHLERMWLGRHKVFHFRVWYRDDLADYVREILFDQRSLARPYVNAESVRTIVNGHLKGNRNYTTEIHRLLTLELTHRLFLDAN